MGIQTESRTYLTDERHRMALEVLALLGDVPQTAEDIFADLAHLQNGGTVDEHRERVRDALVRCREARWVKYERSRPFRGWWAGAYSLSLRGWWKVAREVRGVVINPVPPG